ncbi:MAG: DMT family transporter [Candidatus Eisenbacteria bacterium]|uniref:DMT family transporter n=1 Tax=Eiseniibacteriota bacterium TaxID=2212470 RepID=A0A948RST5_UNCEI|nr:DMT family transporter [Candidatus Eisenbacteria bacterium]MBU1949579.1 DMT family transporter [Candidatus Eisenbacteria bacterium]MBU2689356.1 DMT family transporter [Candidatus Eisenbacteria bacterium]
MIRAVGFAIFAAALFGAATPASKMLLSGLTPFQLAGLLYLGAAIGVAPTAGRSGGIRLPARSDRRNRLRLLGAVVAGGICGPVLLLLGLHLAMAASVSLWLNFELAATALIGVVIFRDQLSLSGWGGVLCAFGGALLLSLPSGTSGLLAGGLVLLGCLCWGVDNHLTALIDGITPSQSTFWKGLAAGTANLAIGILMAPFHAGLLQVLAALFVGAWAYGASITLYISSAQVIGATRAQIAFASAPFFGVLLSVLLLGESLGFIHLGSVLLFILGIGLLTFDRHEHRHEHEAMEHEHAHRHDDEHHDHEHPKLPESERHSHRHRHRAGAHSHPHWPDLHHRHRHK